MAYQTSPRLTFASLKCLETSSADLAGIFFSIVPRLVRLNLVPKRGRGLWAGQKPSLGTSPVLTMVEAVDAFDPVYKEYPRAQMIFDSLVDSWVKLET